MPVYTEAFRRSTAFYVICGSSLMPLFFVLLKTLLKLTLGVQKYQTHLSPKVPAAPKEGGAWRITIEVVK